MKWWHFAPNKIFLSQDDWGLRGRHGVGHAIISAFNASYNTQFIHKLETITKSKAKTNKIGINWCCLSIKFSIQTRYGRVRPVMQISVHH